MIRTEDLWCRECLFTCDSDRKIIEHDLTSAFVSAYHAYFGIRTTKAWEDVVLSASEELPLMRRFVYLYEKKYGKVTNANGKENKSNIPQVLIGAINDTHKHDELMQKLDAICGELT